MNTLHRISLAGMVALSLIGGSAFAEGRRERVESHAGWVLDGRYGHNHYYPPAGMAVRVLPRGYYTVRYGGAPYYFYEGVWYRRGDAGFIVAPAPMGAFIRVLPPFYTTVWFAGVPYYYADDVYYRWDTAQSGYVVSAPPEGEASAAPSGPSGNDEVFAYPNNGQSKEQQATDRYECYRWATDQTGFDPTKSGGGVSGNEIESKRADYRRAQVACLEGRGYNVK